MKVKKNILSEIARIYDHLDFLVPTIEWPNLELKNCGFREYFEVKPMITCMNCSHITRGVDWMKQMKEVTPKQNNIVKQKSHSLENLGEKLKIMSNKLLSRLSNSVEPNGNYRHFISRIIIPSSNGLILHFALLN